MSGELVSIVMPSFNSAPFIEASIASVRAQSYGNWELLVSDDGSTDNTLQIVAHAAAGDPRIRLIASSKNLGPAVARNAAIAQAAGRFIAFLDSDDLWKPEKLQRQLDFMLERGVALSFSSYDRISEDGKPLDPLRVRQPVDYNSLLKSCVIGCLTAVYDTKTFGKVYMPDIRRRQDFGLWLKLLKSVEFAYPIEDSLAIYRVRTNSLSSNKLVAAKFTWRLYRETEKLSLMASAYYFSHYAFRGTWRYLTGALRR